ncbi:MAG: ZIP family metal transporter [Parcubacteria group bacterium]|nr:ZIP family metal transporter [Parcubacteria group bacterium]
MFSISFYAIASVFAVSLVSLVGVFALSLKEDLLRRIIFALVSLAAGALLGDAFIHLVPEAFESIAALPVALLMIGGVLLFFVLEKFLHWHHYHGKENADGSHEHEGDRARAIHPTGYMILVSDGVHNFLDGAIIAAGFLVSIEIGVATTIAIVLHEIPQEIGDFAVLLYSGFSRMRAIFLNFISALLAVLGAAAVLLLGELGANLTLWLIPVAAGGFIYIASADLIPEIHKTTRLGHSLLQFAAMLLGIGAMAMLLAFES